MYNIKLYESKQHLFVCLHDNTDKTVTGIYSNQYLIKHNNKTILLDPGGFNVMAKLLAEMLHYTSLDQVTDIILSHQDPDVLGGIVSWLALTKAKLHISDVWVRFIPHYGIANEGDIDRIYGIPDHGMDFVVDDEYSLRLIPAHFLHSEGNMHVYDPESKILFTGDLGASISNLEEQVFVEDFAKYLPKIKAFHQRYMCSNRAIKAWLKQIERLDIEMLAPQHGKTFTGKAIDDFLRFLDDLACGIDLFDDHGLLQVPR